MASTFQGTKNTAKSADDLKKARETRAAEALRMKDEQLKILSDQNASLLATLDKVREFLCRFCNACKIEDIIMIILCHKKFYF